MLPEMLTTLKELEERLFDPAVRNTPQLVDALLADDFIEFGRSGGVYGKKQVIANLAEERSDAPSELVTYGYELRELAQSVFLLTYRTVRKREGASELRSLRSSIWKLVDGSWQMTFHQGTPTELETGS